MLQHMHAVCRTTVLFSNAEWRRSYSYLSCVLLVCWRCIRTSRDDGLGRKSARIFDHVPGDGPRKPGYHLHRNRSTRRTRKDSTTCMTPRNMALFSGVYCDCSLRFIARIVMECLLKTTKKMNIKCIWATCNGAGGMTLARYCSALRMMYERIILLRELLAVLIVV